ncbi:MAG: hypothetical protein HY905_11245 [Deltaproteobacteria bacterium]|nr:hypothetical protein [Deltaproteobacteria bacterium]
MKAICAFLVIGALAGNAVASNSNFYGTSGVDVITVGRAFDSYGNLKYYACVNGTWTSGGYVNTNSIDQVTVWGYEGSDTLTVRDVNAWYTCGDTARYFYRMDYSYACPGGIHLYGAAGNDVIVGAQCAEDLQGSSGTDTIFGNGGDDIIYGGTENDCIDDDTVYSLSCGAGTDSYTDNGSWNDCENPVDYCSMP